MAFCAIGDRYQGFRFLHGSGTNQPDGPDGAAADPAGADHPPDGADHPPDGAGHPPAGHPPDGAAGHPPDGADGPDGSNPAKQNRTSDQMIRMVLVSLIKLTKLISNKLWC